MAQPIWTRKFLGKTENFESKEEQRFEQKHLRAYIKGYAQFKHGKEKHINEKTGVPYFIDKWHPVKQEVKQINQ